MSCPDCNQIISTCENPCAVTVTNTANCESLPSLMQNFVAAFFGDVVKTEVDGQVTWALPCDLTTGLPENPRAEGEGLACYFKRLFLAGITGLKGDKGDSGDDGAAGQHAFAITLGSFTQPSPGAPNWSVRMSNNPAVAVGATVFIEDSGYHTVTALSGDGTVFLTLVGLISDAPASVPLGKFVVPTGPRGLVGVTGGKGDKGDKGDTGPAGTAWTETNEFTTCGGSGYSLQATYARVLFGGTEPELTLPDAGTYFVFGLVGVTMAADAATNPPEEIKLKLYDAWEGVDVAGSEQLVQAFRSNQRGQIHIACKTVTHHDGHTLQLYGKISVADKGTVDPERTSLWYIRVA